MISFDTFWQYFQSYWPFGFIAFIIYYVFFRAPAPDIVYSSNASDVIADLQNHLNSNGIKTYTKNTSGYENLSEAPTIPSLHVLNVADRDKAIKLLKQKINKNIFDRTM